LISRFGLAQKRINLAPVGQSCPQALAQNEQKLTDINTHKKAPNQSGLFM